MGPLTLDMKFDKGLFLTSNVVIRLDSPENSMEAMAKILTDAHEAFVKSNCNFDNYSLCVQNSSTKDVYISRVTPDDIESGNLTDLLEYAVKHLKSPLIVVMGHDHCGAIEAAVEENGKKQHGNIGAIIDKIEPSVKKVKPKNLQGEKLVEEVTNENIYNSSRAIQESKVIKDELQKGNLKIVEAKYILKSGKVQWLPIHSL